MGDTDRTGEDALTPSEGGPTSDYGEAGVGPGAQIGPYKLLHILGEGGYGIVYLAEQRHPVKRRVALKVIKPGMDTKHVIARFEAERQALALLDHPNVAQIYDAGTTEQGRPYFAMEHVRGVPITQHCDRHKLSIEERLHLFLQVCEAVQHAHQKGIIHRDIKPSNILVSTEGDRAIPKVIDFGVAKATSQPLTERTLFTEQGQLIGTPAYMSPEQAEMTNRDIDTRSDIYSLGILLYELLAGGLPFEHDTLERMALDEVLRVIREEDPPRPSAKLSSLGKEAETVAGRRRSEVRPLVRRLQHELEWIPLKAMRKEPAHRYRTVAELADDITHYLCGEPLVAGPESVTYRARKFIRRNRRLVVGAVAFVVLLVSGTVLVAVLALKEFRARKEAEQQTAIVQAINEFLNSRLLSLADPNVWVDDYSSTNFDPGLEGLLYIKEAADENCILEASIRHHVGNVFLSQREYREAKQHLERVYELGKDLGSDHRLILSAASSLLTIYENLGYQDEKQRTCAELQRMVPTVLKNKNIVAAYRIARSFTELNFFQEAEQAYLLTLDAVTEIDEPNWSGPIDADDLNRWFGTRDGVSRLAKDMDQVHPLLAMYAVSPDAQTLHAGSPYAGGPHTSLTQPINLYGVFLSHYGEVSSTGEGVYSLMIANRIKVDLVLLYDVWGKEEEAMKWSKRIQDDMVDSPLFLAWKHDHW